MRNNEGDWFCKTSKNACSKLTSIELEETYLFTYVSDLSPEVIKIAVFYKDKVFTRNFKNEWFCKTNRCGKKLTKEVEEKYKVLLFNLFSIKAGTYYSCSIKGLSKLPEYKIWCGIKQRCLNKNNTSYINYGKRGIKVFPEWVFSFESFYEYVGSRPTINHSIDRINNDGNYEPGNVRWATWTQQANNRRPRKKISLKEIHKFRKTRTITYLGRTQSIKQWSEETGISISVISKRINSEWPVEKAFTYGSIYK